MGDKFTNAGHKNLIHLTSETAVEVGRKGGSVKSCKKGFAAKIRYWKRLGIGDDELDWFNQRLMDSEASFADIQKYYDDLRPTLHPMQRVAFANTLLGLHKLKFGEKYKVESTNVNINVAVKPISVNMPEGMVDLLKDLEGRKKNDDSVQPDS